MRGVVFLCTTGMSELLIGQLILMLFKVLHFDVLKHTFSHTQSGMHIIIPPIKRRVSPLSKSANNSASFKIEVGISKTFFHKGCLQTLG